MKLIPIERLNKREIRKMKCLNKETFPKNERIRFDQLLELSISDQFDFLAIIEQTVFMGFFLVAKNDKTVYLFFYSMIKKYRTRGYGGQIMALLRNYYRDQQIVLDLMEIDEDAFNAKQREMKKNFYEHNGFYETGYDMCHGNVRFELLSSTQSFDSQQFMHLMDEIKGAISAIKNKPFEPVITKKINV